MYRITIWIMSATLHSIESVSNIINSAYYSPSNWLKVLLETFTCIIECCIKKHVLSEIFYSFDLRIAYILPLYSRYPWALVLNYVNCIFIYLFCTVLCISQSYSSFQTEKVNCDIVTTKCYMFCTKGYNMMHSSNKNVYIYMYCQVSNVNYR